MVRDDCNLWLTMLVETCWYQKICQSHMNSFWMPGEMDIPSPFCVLGHWGSSLDISKPHVMIMFQRGRLNSLRRREGSGLYAALASFPGFLMSCQNVCFISPSLLLVLNSQIALVVPSHIVLSTRSTCSAASRACNSRLSSCLKYCVESVAFLELYELLWNKFKQFWTMVIRPSHALMYSTDQHFLNTTQMDCQICLNSQYTPCNMEKSHKDQPGHRWSAVATTVKQCSTSSLVIRIVDVLSSVVISLRNDPHWLEWNLLFPAVALRSWGIQQLQERSWPFYSPLDCWTGTYQHFSRAERCRMPATRSFTLQFLICLELWALLDKSSNVLFLAGKLIFAKSAKWHSHSTLLHLLLSTDFSKKSIWVLTRYG